MVEHLIGLQAQENLPPYLSLAARIDDFDPHELSDAIERRDAVRLLTMRGTIHVLTPDDALSLRRWVQPALDKQSASNQNNRPARGVPADDVVAATRKALSDGPLPVRELGERVAEAFQGVPATALAHMARERAPLVQVPPRGLWGQSGGVVYQTVESWLGRESVELDVQELVRRYLRAFGPATAADMTTWSRVTRLGPVFAAMKRRAGRGGVRGRPHPLRRARCAVRLRGRPAPVRLLGSYDNVWLSHADRAHIVPEDARRRWMGSNGGVGSTVFVDGFMAGLWWWRDGKRRHRALPPADPRPAHRAGDRGRVGGSAVGSRSG